MAPSTFSIGSTTVSISSLDSKMFPNRNQQFVKTEDNSSDSDSESPLLNYPKKTTTITNPPASNPPPTNLTTEQKDALKLKKLKSVLKNPLAAANKTKTATLVRKEAHRILQHSSIYKKTLQIKQRRSKKFKLNRFQPQEEENKSSSGGGGKNMSSKKKAAAAKVKVKSRGRVTK